MTLKRDIAKIREMLDELSNAKTVEKKCKLLFMMKVHIELLEEPLKKRRDHERKAFNKNTRIIKKALKQFLTALDKIFAKHEELGDTAVRDKMFSAIFKRFIQPEEGYTLPTQFGMFDEQADVLVRAAIQKFIEHPEVAAACKVLKSPGERLNAFQDYDVKTSQGTIFGEFFGFRGKIGPGAAPEPTSAAS